MIATVHFIAKQLTSFLEVRSIGGVVLLPLLLMLAMVLLVSFRHASHHAMIITAFHQCGCLPSTAGWYIREVKLCLAAICSCSRRYSTISIHGEEHEVVSFALLVVGAPSTSDQSRLLG